MGRKTNITPWPEQAVPSRNPYRARIVGENVGKLGAHVLDDFKFLAILLQGLFQSAICRSAPIDPICRLLDFNLLHTIHYGTFHFDHLIFFNLVHCPIAATFDAIIAGALSEAPQF